MASLMVAKDASKILALALGILTSQTSWSTELSGNLSSSQVTSSVEILSLGSAHRGWTAPALENTGLGLDVGIENAFLFRQSLADYGNGQGIIPRIIPVPGFWIAWDLPDDIQVSGSFSPGFLFEGITTVGLGGQWTFFNDKNSGIVFSVAGDYTYASAFGDLTSNTIGGAVQASKDLAVWQPYLGAGFLVAEASINPARLGTGVSDGSYFVPRTHLYAGARIDLAAKLSFQFDLIGLTPAFALLLALRY